MTIEFDQIIDSQGKFLSFYSLGFAIEANYRGGSWCLSLVGYSRTEEKFFVVHQKFSLQISFLAVHQEIASVMQILKESQQRYGELFSLPTVIYCPKGYPQYLKSQSKLNSQSSNTLLRFVPVQEDRQDNFAVLHGLRNDGRVVVNAKLLGQPVETDDFLRIDGDFPSLESIPTDVNETQEIAIACALCKPELMARRCLEWV